MLNDHVQGEMKQAYRMQLMENSADPLAVLPVTKSRAANNERFEVNNSRSLSICLPAPLLRAVGHASGDWQNVFFLFCVSHEYILYYQIDCKVRGSDLII